MAGGPIGFSSFYPGASGNIFQYFYSGAGGNASPVDEGVGVVASLGSDSTCQLRFPMPPAAAIPSGTLKLLVTMLTSDTNAGHVAKLTVSDAAVAAAASPSAASLTAETQLTLTLPATPADKYLQGKVTLSATPAGNDFIVMAVVFNTTGWTISQIATFLFQLIWE